MPLACLIHFAESIATKSLKENDPFFNMEWSFFSKRYFSGYDLYSKKYIQFSSAAHLNEW